MPETKEVLQFLFCKNTINLEECVAAITLLFCHSLNGWMQLELRVNSIPLKKGITVKPSKTQYP